MRGSRSPSSSSPPPHPHHNKTFLMTAAKPIVAAAAAAAAVVVLVVVVVVAAAAVAAVKAVVVDLSSNRAVSTVVVCWRGWRSKFWQSKVQNPCQDRLTIGPCIRQERIILLIYYSDYAFKSYGCLRPAFPQREVCPGCPWRYSSLVHLRKAAHFPLAPHPSTIRSGDGYAFPPILELLFSRQEIRYNDQRTSQTVLSVIEPINGTPLCLPTNT